eukprot:gene28910-35918_t
MPQPLSSAENIAHSPGKDVTGLSPKRDSDPKMESEVVHLKVLKALPLLLTYCLASSSMLIVNKVAIRHFPLPMAVMWLQIGFTCVLLSILRTTGTISFPRFDFAKAYSWAPVALAWLAPMVFNMKALQTLNAETVIVFRMLSTA